MYRRRTLYCLRAVYCHDVLYRRPILYCHRAVYCHHAMFRHRVMYRRCTMHRHRWRQVEELCNAGLPDVDMCALPGGDDAALAAPSPRELVVDEAFTRCGVLLPFVMYCQV